MPKNVNGISKMRGGGTRAMPKSRWILAGVAATLMAASSPAALAEVQALQSQSCDRACLAGVLARYQTALQQRNPGIAPLARNFVYTENEVRHKLGAGIWTVFQAWTPYRIVALDPETGQIGLMAIARINDRRTFVSIRLRVAGKRITEADAIVAGDTLNEQAASPSGLTGFETAADRLDVARPGFAEPTAPRERTSRRSMTAAALSYYHGIEVGSGEVVAFGNQCHRIENGVAQVNNPSGVLEVSSPEGKTLPNFLALNCTDQFNTELWTTDEVTSIREPIVDMVTGVVMIPTLYQYHSKGQCAESVRYGKICPAKPIAPTTLDLLEAFKIRSGQIAEMESVWSILPRRQTRSLWCRESVSC